MKDKKYLERIVNYSNRTAKLNNLQVSKYLEYVLDNIQNKDIKDLLPYSKNLPKELLNT